MAAQTVPANTPGNISALSFSETYQAAQKSFLLTLLVDVYTLRNELDAAVTLFNAHTHKTPTSNPGATSTPTSDAGGSGSTGGTASTMTTPANVVAGA